MAFFFFFFCNIPAQLLFTGISLHSWNRDYGISRASLTKMGHVTTHEDKIGNTVFLLPSQAPSATPCISTPDTHSFQLPQCPACRHLEHFRNSSQFCCLSSHPSCTDRSSKVLDSTAPPTDVKTLGLLHARKSSGILWQISDKSLWKYTSKEQI